MTIAVAVSFTTDPAATPSWTDISDYVLALSIRRGAARPGELPAAGTCTLTLDNRDRRFDPSETGGAYYPNVRPMKRVRVRKTYNAVTYDLFHGFVDEWPIKPWGAMHTQVDVTASDGFKVLALAKIRDASYAEEHADARVAGVLDDTMWPAADRDISTATHTVIQAVEVDESDALTLLRDVQAAEYGRLFVAADGLLTFLDRHWIYRAPWNTSQGTFADGGAGGGLPYLAVTPVYDDRDIYNDVRVTRVGGTPQAATDATSQARYLIRSLTRDGLLMTSDAEAASQAHYLLLTYKEPVIRLSDLEFNPEADPDALWPQVLGRELGDRITVRWKPAGGSTVLVQDSTIESITHDTVGDGRWTTTWGLAAVTIPEVWILGTGELGDTVGATTTRLGY